MRYIYRPDGRYLPVLVFILFFLLAAPVVILSLIEEDFLVKLAAGAVNYAAFSPLIYALAKLIYSIMRATVTVDGQGAEYISPGRNVALTWDELSSIVLEYISLDGGRFTGRRDYVLCIIEGETGSFCFNRTADDRDYSGQKSFRLIDSRKMKSAESMGIYMNRRDFVSLLDLLRDYSGLEPVKRTHRELPPF